MFFFVGFAPGEADPAPSPSPEVTPAVTQAPIDYEALQEEEGLSATVEDFYHRPFEELPQALRDSLEWDGEITTYEGYNLRLREYTAPGIQITTTEAPEEVLRQWLDWQLAIPMDDEARAGTDEELRAEFEREKGREWLHSVRITDDSYSTALGLKVGVTVEEAEALGYPLSQRLNGNGSAFFGDIWEHNMEVYVQNGVVTELALDWGLGRYVGKYWDL